MLENGLTMNVSSEDSQKKKSTIVSRPKINRICKSNTKIEYGQEVSDDDSSEGSVGEAQITEEVCLVCGEYGKNEIWLKRISCGQWTHKECTNQEKNNFL